MKPPEVPFAAEGGRAASAPAPEDPYLMLDDLMAVVEVLCPVWPGREVANAAGKLLL